MIDASQFSIEPACLDIYYLEEGRAEEFPIPKVHFPCLKCLNYTQIIALKYLNMISLSKVPELIIVCSLLLSGHCDHFPYVLDCFYLPSILYFQEVLVIRAR